MTSDVDTPRPSDIDRSAMISRRRGAGRLIDHRVKHAIVSRAVRLLLRATRLLDRIPRTVPCSTFPQPTRPPDHNSRSLLAACRLS